MDVDTNLLLYSVFEFHYFNVSRTRKAFHIKLIILTDNRWSISFSDWARIHDSKGWPRARSTSKKACPQQWTGSEHISRLGPSASPEPTMLKSAP